MKKIQQIIIMLAVLIFAAAGNGAMAQLIELGGWNTGDWSSIFIPKAALDTASGLTHIPEGYSVKQFTISGKIEGLSVYAISNSYKLTTEQRDILRELKRGDSFFVTGIVLVDDLSKEERELNNIKFYIVDKPLFNAIEHNIDIGGWNTGDWSSIFIPKAALDTASCLTHIPEGYSVKSFTIGLTKGGYFRSETSNSSQLTLEQRAMIAECNIGDVLYLEDIYLVNDSTKEERYGQTVKYSILREPIIKQSVNENATKSKATGNNRRILNNRRIPTHLGFGKYNTHNCYIPQSVLDTIRTLTNIPEHCRVRSFEVSVDLNGFYCSEKSVSRSLNSKQMSLIYQVPVGGKIYFEDIQLVKLDTFEIVKADDFYLIKDGVNAKGDFDYDDWYRGVDTIHPHIYAFPSFNSKISDSTKYIVKSFRIEAFNPDYIFSYEIDGNQIDSVTYSDLTKFGKSFWIKDIRCTEVATGKDVYASPIKPKENCTKRLFRSKDYFLKPNSKIDFFYKQDFKIDSVQVKELVPNAGFADYNILSQFNGNVFPKDLKAIVKKLKPFTILYFTIFFNCKEETVMVVIVE